MKHVWLTVAILAALVGGAIAQSYPRWGGALTGIADWNGQQFGSANPFPITSSSGAPVVVVGMTAVKGFGTLSATATSTQLSTLTVGPSSPAFSTAGLLYVVNSAASAGIVYVCPLGGTCSATVGVPIAAGGAYGFYQPASTMTVYAASTATVVAQW